MSEFLPPPPPSGQPWANVGPYGHTSAPMPPMRSLKGLAAALTILFAIIALVDAIAAAMRLNRANLLSDVVENPASVDFQDLLDADNNVAAATGFHVLFAIALIVVVIIWQFRHAKNAETLGVRGGLGPGWAIGGWFIPIANFVLPAVQMFQSSKGSDVEARRVGRPPKGAGIIIAWAIVFGAGALMLGSAGALVSSDDEGNVIIESEQDVKDAETSDTNAGYGHMLFVVAALLGIAMVRTLTQRQTDAYAQVGAAASNQVPPPPGGPMGAPPPAAPTSFPPPPPPSVPPAPPPSIPPAPPPSDPGDFAPPT